MEREELIDIFVAEEDFHADLEEAEARLRKEHRQALEDYAEFEQQLEELINGLWAIGVLWNGEMVDPSKSGRTDFRDKNGYHTHPYTNVLFTDLTPRDDQIDIYFSYNAGRGETDYMNITIPIAWIGVPLDDIAAAWDRDRNMVVLAQKKAKEQRERAEYDRLRDKYGDN